MKDIKDYEGLYAITSCGRVWSYLSKMFMKPNKKQNGYLEVTLTRNGKKKSFLIHRLVAETYIPNPEQLPQVGHKDETRDKNYIRNLCWTSAKDNCNMPLHLERKSKSHMNNTNSKKVLCVETNIIYPSISEAARNQGCTPQNIYQACQSRYRIACGYHWRYIDE